MANVIKLKNSGTANSAPTSLEAGELAINYADGKIYYKNASNAITSFAPKAITTSDTPPSSPSAGDLWYESDTGKTFIYYDSFWVEIGAGSSAQPNSIALGTDTIGDYVQSLVAGTNIAISNNSGEGATPTISVTGNVASFDSISTPDYIQFDTTYTPVTLAPGKMQWDPDYGTLQLGMIGGNVNLQIGQEMLVRVYNDSLEGTALVDGEMVFINGVQGARPSVRRAGASNSIDASKPLGMVTETIAWHQFGFICISGAVHGLNTAAYNPGDILYLSTTEGALTTTRPSPPTDVVFVGVVLRANAGNGAIWVAPQNGYKLTEMHDVSANTPSSGDFLKYNGTLWVNDPINLGTDTVGNYMSNVSAGTGIAVSHTPGEGSTATISIESTAWTAYTPTITADGGGFALNNGTLTGRYKQVGKTVFFKLKFVFCSTTAAGTGHWNFSLPVTAYDSNFTFTAAILDNSVAWYGGIGNGNYTGSTSSFAVIIPGTNASVTTWASVGNGGPFIWGTDDNITISGSYEAA